VGWCGDAWLAVVIATIKVLGLKARDFAAVATAARRVVEYVQGGIDQPRRPDPLGYYAGRHAPVKGRALGSAAGLVGLSGKVSAAQLERLLTGRHAVTGQWLLPAVGSAGRAGARLPRPLPPLGDLPEVLTLSDAAAIAGVSPRYLARLARQQALVDVAAAASGDGDLSGDGGTERRPVRDRLRAIRDPETGKWLVPRAELARFMTEREPPTVVIGYDLTCAVPKSVSLLWAFGDESLRKDIAAALDAGVEAALAYLERHATFGTVGGKNRPGLGLAVASYRHELSRAEEPHLHDHNIIVNAVLVPLIANDGAPMPDERGVARVERRALDSEVLHAHVKTAGYIGAAALRHTLARSRGLSWGQVRNGVAELADFPADLLESFSSRHGETHEEFAQLVDAGFTPDAATMAAAQRGSRKAKRILPDAEVAANHAARLAAAGWTPEQVSALGAGRERRLQAPPDSEVSELFDRLAGPHGVTERQSTFTAPEVCQQVGAWASDRLDGDAIEGVAEGFLADPRVVHLQPTPRRRRNRPERIFTTVGLLEAEDSLLALCRQGRVDRGALPRATVDPATVEGAIAAVGVQLREARGDPGARLSDEQADLVRALLASNDLVRPVIGPAGTGKTEAMRAVVRALSEAGFAVLGTANGGRQAEDLHERLDVPARVVSSWLTLLDHAEDPHDVWPPGTTLVVDEATQVSTRDAERLVRYATRTGAVLILVGDPAQLGSVGAGGWFAHLVDAMPDTPALTINQRQRDPRLAEVRSALAALRSPEVGLALHALQRLAADGRVRLFDTRDELLAAVVDDWHSERRARRAAASAERAMSRMMAENHRDADLLNRAARERLRQDGTLRGAALRAAGREFQVGDEVITLTQAGHTLVPTGAPRSEYVRTGTVGTVRAVHLDPDVRRRQALTARFPGKGDVLVDWAYLTHRFPDGRDGGLAHAYALTAHKAEGATIPTARAVVPDDTSRPGLYVMLSRASEDLCAYLIRRRDLEADQDDEDWLPILDDATGVVSRLVDHLAQSRAERLASEHDPIAHAAHAVGRQHDLAELTALRRQATAQPGGVPDPHVLRRAELAAEAAIAARAPGEAPPELIARIGPRPHGGADRALWDRAVAALAIYHARHRPPVPRHVLGPPPADAGDGVESRWRQLRAHARQLAAGWAAHLDETRERRFHHRGQAVPRDRAIVGIHALLDHGWTPAALAARLTQREQDTVRSGAAVLDRRVQALLDRTGTDPTPYELAPPPTPRDEWDHTARLLHAAETHHLAARPTAELAAELHRLTRFLTADPTARRAESTVADTDPTAVRQRRHLIDAALARQIDHAATVLVHQPADYLVALLGARLTDPASAAVWDQRALAVEHYRHYVLGLPYGTRAAPPHAPAAEQALGPRPARASHRRRHDELRNLQATLDLGRRTVPHADI
jgi:conjugative relaxase-like TrwC/TraI family protein